METLIKLAESIEKKYRKQYCIKKEATLKKDWLIFEISHLLRVYPSLGKLITSDMPLSSIALIINGYIDSERQRRELKLDKLKKLLNDNWQYRHKETLVILMLIGYSFNQSIIRLKNNQTKVGEYFKPEESESVVNILAYPMPEQDKFTLNRLVRQLESTNVSDFHIQLSINKLLNSFNQSYITLESLKKNKP